MGLYTFNYYVSQFLFALKHSLIILFFSFLLYQLYYIPGMVAHTCNFSTWDVGTTRLSLFKANLSYMSIRLAWATELDPVYLSKFSRRTESME